MNNSLAKNSFYNLIYKTFNVLFPLISATYIARVLNVEGIGKVAAAQNIAQYFVIIAALGLNSYGTRAIAKASNDLDKRFSELFLINFISTTLCSIAYYYMIFEFDFFSSERKLYCVVGLNIILNYFNVDWFYQGKEEYRYIMLRSIMVKLISLVALFLCVKEKQDYIRYALITCLATAGNYVFNIYNLRKYTSFTLKEIKLTIHLKGLIILLASSIAIELYTMVDTTMLNIMQTEVEVGYYTNAVKIIRMVSNCIIALGSVALPRLSMCFSNNQIDEYKLVSKSIFKTLVLFALPATIGVFFLADTIVLVLFGKSFCGAIDTIRILSVLILVFSIAGGFTAPILISKGNERKYLLSVISGAIVNLLLNSFLIVALRHNGAAIASVCAEITVLLMQYFFSDTSVKEFYTSKELCSIVCSNVAMLFCVLIVKSIVTSVFLELFFSVCFGGIVFWFVCVVMGNQQVCSMTNKVFSYISKK